MTNSNSEQIDLLPTSLLNHVMAEGPAGSLSHSVLSLIKDSTLDSIVVSIQHLNAGAHSLETSIRLMNQSFTSCNNIDYAAQLKPIFIRIFQIWIDKIK